MCLVLDLLRLLMNLKILVGSVGNVVVMQVLKALLSCFGKKLVVIGAWCDVSLVLNKLLYSKKKL